MAAENLFDLPKPEPLKLGFDTYLSPFSYRYGSKEMRANWSQRTFWSKARSVWLYVAETQMEAGLVTQAQVDELRNTKDLLSVERIFQFERDPEVGTGHDGTAAIAEWSEVAPEGGKILHRSLTTEDNFSNVEVWQIQDAFGIIRPKVIGTLKSFAGRVDQYKGLTAMGYTHLQPADPTTMGYRFAKYAQDLLIDLKFMDYIRTLVKGKGIKGPVGTYASIEDVLRETGMTPEEHERRIMAKLELEYDTITDQTYPRKHLFLTTVALASIGQSLHRFAFDMQILQSAWVGEVSEPRRKGQKGSSVMPHKQNPIQSENICSLTEDLAGKVNSAWTTGAFVNLERTLRDSAGKRSWLPESFLIADEALTRSERLIGGLTVHETAVTANMNKFAPFNVSSILLGRLANAGMDRKKAHDILVDVAEKAYDAIRSGQPNPMIDLLKADKRVVKVIGEAGVESAYQEVFSHIGPVPQICERFLKEELFPAIEKNNG